MEDFCKPGDILLYARAPNLNTRLIQFGERLEDGPQPVEYYHVAIALGPYDKIEAQGHSVAIAPIDYGKFAVFRPPIEETRINAGLAYLRTLVGQPYDWVLIIDLALRMISRGFIHLPLRWVKSEERRKKICSSLVQVYFTRAHFGHLHHWPLPTPEDIWLQVRRWPVNLHEKGGA